jgi:hypothetical protein
MRGRIELAFGFVECDACQQKAAGQVLCEGCIHNQARAIAVQESYEVALKWESVAGREAARALEALRDLAEMYQYATSLEDTITDLSLRLSEATRSPEDHVADVVSAVETIQRRYREFAAVAGEAGLFDPKGETGGE